MSKRHKQRRKKSPPPRRDAGDEKKPLPPPRPPRRNLPLLIGSLTLMCLWLAFLAMMAVVVLRQG